MPLTVADTIKVYGAVLRIEQQIAALEAVIKSLKEEVAKIRAEIAD